MLENLPDWTFLVRKIAHSLQKGGVANSVNEAIWILEHTCQKTKSELLQGLQKMSPSEWQQIQNIIQHIIQQRLNGKPLAYILQTIEFWKEEFLIREPLLIPRKETEILLEVALKFIDKYSSKKILEVGCGCGALTLSLALEKRLNITAIDIHPLAIEVSKINQQKYQKKLQEKGTKLEFIQKDVQSFFCSFFKKFDIILSNPPYIAYKEKNQVSTESLHFEDHKALFAPCDGLFFYELFATSAREILQTKGLIILEHGYQQKQKIIDIFSKKNWQYIFAAKDLSTKDRVLVFQAN